MKAIDAIKTIFDDAQWEATALNNEPPFLVELESLSIAFCPLDDTVFTIRGYIADLQDDATTDFELLSRLCKLSAGLMLEHRQRVIVDSKKVYLEIDIDAESLDETALIDLVSSFLDNCDMFIDYAKDDLKYSNNNAFAWGLLR